MRFAILYDQVEDTCLGVSIERTVEGAKRKFASSVRRFYNENHEKMGNAECLTFLAGLRLFLGSEFEESQIPALFGPDVAQGYEVVTSPSFAKDEKKEEATE